MARRKKHSPEQVVNLLRQIEEAIANGKHSMSQQTTERLAWTVVEIECKKTSPM